MVVVLIPDEYSSGRHSLVNICDDGDIMGGLDNIVVLE